MGNNNKTLNLPTMGEDVTGTIFGSPNADEESVWIESSEISDSDVEYMVQEEMLEDFVATQTEMERNPDNWSDNDIEVNNRIMDKIKELSRELHPADEDYIPLMKTGFYMQYSDAELDSFRDFVSSELSGWDVDSPQYSRVRDVLDKIDAEQLSRRVHE